MAINGLPRSFVSTHTVRLRRTPCRYSTEYNPDESCRYIRTSASVYPFGISRVSTLSPTFIRSAASVKRNPMLTGTRPFKAPTGGVKIRSVSAVGIMSDNDSLARTTFRRSIHCIVHLAEIRHNLPRRTYRRGRRCLRRVRGKRPLPVFTHPHRHEILCIKRQQLVKSDHGAVGCALYRNYLRRHRGGIHGKIVRRIFYTHLEFVSSMSTRQVKKSALRVVS